jgi:two-component system OmpR family response regulator
MRILVVEDDAAIADAVCATLEGAGHLVDHLANGNAALAALREHAFSLVVLDLGLPGLDGTDLLRRIRADGDGVPVLVITARDELDLRIRTLDLGADDYLVKPFSLAELDARVRAVLRRHESQGLARLRLGKLAVDFAGREVLCDGKVLELTPREFSLLEVLAAHPNHVVSREHVIEALCTWSTALSDNGLDISIHRLRRKLDASGVNLRTVRGLGYLLEADDGP